MDIFHFWDVLASIITNHRSASLIPGSKHLLKNVTYVTCNMCYNVINEHANRLDVRDDISEKRKKYISHTF